MRGNISNEMLLVAHKVCQTKRPLGTPVKCVKRNVPLASPWHKTSPWHTLITVERKIQMRLFIAINFGEKLKNSIQNIIKDIKKYSRKGRFVKNEHMHLTLEFLGEIPAGEVALIEEAMEQVSCRSFALELSEIGRFKRRGGDIYWIGLRKNQSLFKMQKELHNLLLEGGFELESRKYNPHLTIGRRVVMDDTFDPDKYIEQLRGLNITVDKIDLMKSEHIDGKLKHTVIFSRAFH